MPKKPKWNELPCPECKEPVAFDAKRCPHCQAVYPDSWIEARKASHGSNQKVGLGCLAIVVILLLGMCVFGGGERKSVDDRINGEELSVQAPAPGSATPAVAAAVKKLHDDIMAGVSACDVAGKELAERADGFTTGATSMYDGYRLASRVEESCRESWRQVSQIQAPSALTGAARKSAEEAIDTCENAMIAKQMSGRAMKEVFDGDMRPSKVEDSRQKADTSQAGTLACVAGIFDTAGKAGVDLAKIGK
jgi:hypothetical protein